MIAPMLSHTSPTVNAPGAARRTEAAKSRNAACVPGVLETVVPSSTR
jgi:hypothetical protein